MEGCITRNAFISRRLMKLLLCLQLVAANSITGKVAYRLTKIPFSSIRMSSNVESDRNIHFSNPRWEGVVTAKDPSLTFIPALSNKFLQSLQLCGTAELNADNFSIPVHNFLTHLIMKHRYRCKVFQRVYIGLLVKSKKSLGWQVDHLLRC